MRGGVWYLWVGMSVAQVCTMVLPRDGDTSNVTDIYLVVNALGSGENTVCLNVSKQGHSFVLQSYDPRLPLGTSITAHFRYFPRSPWCSPSGDHCDNAVIHHLSLPSTNSVLARIQLSQGANLTFTNVTFSGEFLVKGDCGQDWCRHCLTSDYIYPDATGTEVLFPDGMKLADIPKATQESMNCRRDSSFPLFVFAHPTAIVTFGNCVIEEFRAQLAGFLFFLNGGQAYFADTTIRKIDYAYDKGFIWGAMSGAAISSLVFLRVLVEDFSYGRAVNDTSAQCAPFIQLNSVVNLTIADSIFRNNLMLAGIGLEGKVRFIDVKNVQNRFVLRNSLFEATMGGVAVSVNNENRTESEPDFLIENSTFVRGFSSKAPVLLDLSTRLRSVGAIRDCTFTGANSDSDSPIVKIAMQAADSNLTLHRVTFQGNNIAGKAVNSPLIHISSVSRIDITDSAFAGNSGFTSNSQSYYSYAVEHSLLPKTHFTENRPKGACSSVLALSQITHFSLQNDTFVGKPISCATFVSISSPNFSSKGRISDCKFTTNDGIAVLFDTIATPAIYQIAHSLFIGNTQSAVVFLESHNSGSAGLIVSNCRFEGNGLAEVSRGGAIDLTGSILAVNFTVFSGNRGETGGVRFTHVTSTDSSLFEVANSEFSSNAGTGLGADLQLLVLRPENRLLNVTISNSSFGQFVSTGSTGSVCIGKVAIRQGLISNCQFDRGEVSSGGVIDVYIHSGLLGLRNVTFSRIALTNSGGMVGIHSKSATVSIDSSKFVGLVSAFLLKVDSGAMHTRHCTFVNNTSQAILMLAGVYTDLSSRFDSNKGDIGVIRQSGGSAALTNTSFTRNSGLFGPGIGRIEGQNTSFLSTNCLFDGNVGGKQQPGLIYAERSAEISLIGCEIVNNVGFVSVLSAFFLSFPVRISDSMMRNNTGDYVISLSQAKAQLVSVTLTENRQLAVSAGFRMSKSTLEIQDSVIEFSSGREGCAIFSDFGSELTVQRTTFRNLVCESSLFLLENTTFSFDSVLFAESVVRSGAVIEAKAAKAGLLSQCEFRSLSASPALILLREVSTVSLSHCHFTAIPCGGVSLTTADTVVVSAAVVSDCIHSSDTGFVHIHDSLHTAIAHSLFRNVTGGRHGAVSVSNTADARASVDIENSTFVDCAGNGSGGAFANVGSIHVRNASFVACKGGTGGGLFLTCQFASVCEATVSASSFVNNTAVSGGGLYWNRAKPAIAALVFAGNQARYGPDLASVAAYASPVDLSPSKSLTLVSSSRPRTPLNIGIFDIYGQLICNDNGTEVRLSSGSAGVMLAGETVKLSLSGVCQFSNFTISAAPGSSAQLTTSSSTISQSQGQVSPPQLLTPSVSFPVFLRLCELGEIVVNGTACEECPSETYSPSGNSTLCLPCTPQATCKGGSYVYPQAGYWRSDSTQYRFYECPNPHACLAGLERGLTTGDCAEGYRDNVCQSCAPGFSRSGKDVCSACPTLAVTVVKLVGMLGLTVALVVWTVYSALKSAEKQDDLQSVYTKVVLNYFQLSSMLTTFSLKWPDAVLTAFRYQSLIGETSDQAFAFDCFPDVGTDIPKFYQKIVALTALPAVLFAAISLLFASKYVASQRTAAVATHFFVTLIVTLFLIQPNLMRVFVSSLNCGELAPGELWVKDEMALRCWSRQHSTYAIGSALPGILVWCLGVPSLSLLYLIRLRKTLKSPATRSVFGFLYIGYTESAYYWEFVILVRKVLLVCISVFLSRSKPLTQALTVLIVLFVSFSLSLVAKPFTSRPLNALELGSIAASSVTVVGGMYYITEDLGQGTRTVLLYAILGLNASFLGWWGCAYAQFIGLGIVKRCPRLCAKWGISREARALAKQIVLDDEYLTDIRHYATGAPSCLPATLQALYLSQLRRRY